MEHHPKRNLLPRDYPPDRALDHPLREGRPQDQGDVIDPFLKSGAWTDLSAGDDTVQLVAYHYIPAGRTGFVKQIQAVPYLPSLMAAGAGGGNILFYSPNAFGTIDPINGYWKTPAGWKAYRQNVFPLPDGDRPVWKWSIRIIDGNIEEIRDSINNSLGIGGVPLPAGLRLWGYPPYSLPRGIYYPSGLPGRYLSDFPPQELQRFGDEPELHLVIPERSTVCLFVECKQTMITPSIYSFITDLSYTPELSTYILGPAFGFLAGYTQANNSDTTRANAREGW